MGFCLSTAASCCSRSELAAAVKRIVSAFAAAARRVVSASATASKRRRSASALLSVIFDCAAASAFCTVASFRASASRRDSSICFFFSVSVYFIASASALREIGADVAEPLGIEAVAHGNGKADRQAFARLNSEDFALAGRVRRRRRGEQVVAKIIHGHALYQRYD